MQWNKDTLKEARTSAKLSQPALAEALGVHFRTVQNWEKGATPIPKSVSLALDKLFGDTQNHDVVSREEYNKVVDYFIDLGLANGFMQEKTSAKTDFIPSFDGTGVK